MALLDCMLVPLRSKKATAFDLAVSVFEKFPGCLCSEPLFTRGAGWTKAKQEGSLLLLETRIFYADFHVAPGAINGPETKRDPIPGEEAASVKQEYFRAS